MGEPIPLTRSKATARVFLDLCYMLKLDTENRLTTVQSQIQLKVLDDASSQSANSSIQSVLTYDYTQNPDNDYPRAHLHFDGNSVILDKLLNITHVPDKKSADLHIPVGSPRFRPCLEDVIEFCIVEGLVTPDPDWQLCLNRSRKKYLDDQLRSAILERRDLAIEILKDLGYSVRDPASGV